MLSGVAKTPAHSLTAYNPASPSQIKPFKAPGTGWGQPQAPRSTANVLPCQAKNKGTCPFLSCVARLVNDRRETSPLHRRASTWHKHALGRDGGWRSPSSASTRVPAERGHVIDDHRPPRTQQQTIARGPRGGPRTPRSPRTKPIQMQVRSGSTPRLHLYASQVKQPPSRHSRFQGSGQFTTARQGIRTAAGHYRGFRPTLATGP